MLWTSRVYIIYIYIGSKVLSPHRKLVLPFDHGTFDQFVKTKKRKRCRLLFSPEAVAQRPQSNGRMRIRRPAPAPLMPSGRKESQLDEDHKRELPRIEGFDWCPAAKCSALGPTIGRCTVHCTSLVLLEQ